MIKLLDKKTRELISAGEVVERPASVVKELVENAIDSGATAISVEINCAGIAEICVSDNGCGIPYDDIKTAFMKNATSKISNEADLEDIRTLGFRGEALSSISAVARVEMITKTADGNHGGRYTCEGGENAVVEPVGASDGTVVRVRDLFYNTPARMKFLKSDSSEGAAAQSAVEQQALAHPEIAFSLFRDGKEVFSTAGDNRLTSAMFCVFPSSVAASMIEVSADKNGVSVYGYVSSPEGKRASRALQYAFVNGRYVKDKTILAAAENAFSSVAGKNGYPAFVINVELSPAAVDVNVHPAKTTIRFADERSVFSAVYHAVKNALDNKNETVEEIEISSNVPVESTVSPYQPALSDPILKKVAPIFTFSGEDFEPLAPPPIEHVAQTTFTENEFVQSKLDVEYEEYPDNTVSDDTVLRIAGELYKTYIVCEYGDEVVFVDKHAAHERILFEACASDNGKIDRQILVEPLVVSLSSQEAATVIENNEVFERLGYSIDRFGDKDVAVRETPSYIPLRSVSGAVQDMARQLSEGKRIPDSLDRLHLLQSISCRAAVKANEITNEAELLAIAKKILSGEIPKYCPHGRPVYFTLSKKELERRFDRG